MNATLPVSFKRQTLASWWPVLALAAAALLFGLGGEAVREWGRYERAALEAGQLWRLLTAHLVHLGAGHLLLNVAALIVIRFLVDDLLSAREWLGAALVSALAVDAGLYFFAPEVGWYVGFSGVLHGLLAAGIVAMLPAQAGFAAVLGVALAGTLVWEQVAGPLPFSEATSGGPVIVMSHLFGTIGGAAFALPCLAVRGRRNASL